MHVVLLQTVGNQAYIFATNRLRENVGASELTYQMGTKVVLDVVADLGGRRLWDQDPTRLRDNITDKRLNAPLGAGTPIEVVTATSGKALLLTRSHEIAQEIVRGATRNALVRAPGIEFYGVVSEEVNANEGRLHEAINATYGEFERVRSFGQDARVRFPGLPVIARCASSEWPASDTETDPDGEVVLRSRVVVAKREASRAWRDRAVKLVKGAGLARDVNALEQLVDDLDFVAVLHADGNGVGSVFRRFWEYAGCPADAEFVDKLRDFSLALEEATEAALNDAIAQTSAAIGGEKRTAILPLVLGGDDMTLMCDGRASIRLMAAYLRAFEKHTEARDRRGGIIREIAQKAHDRPWLSACGGVAIVKPHFPFHAAYSLAEELLRSAKLVKQRVSPCCSSLDFHVLLDAGFSHLDGIRQRLVVGESQGVGAALPTRARLYTRPYVVSPWERLRGMAGTEWAEVHRFEQLERRVKALLAFDEDEGRRKLPNGQLHELRDGIFAGRSEADARLQLIWARYNKDGLGDLVESAAPPPTLFRPAGGQSDVVETYFLDALEAAGYWGEGDLK